MRMALLADDLTGALDAGVQWALKGLPALAVWQGMGGEMPIENLPLVLDAESRNVPPEIAAARVREMLALPGLRLVYKKMDSTLRGNLGADLKVLLETHPGILVAPALPAQGRVTRQGRVWVHGVPLADTDIGRDPMAGVPTGDIVALLAAQGVAACSLSVGQGEAGARAALAQGVRVLVGDAETDEDLRVWAQVCGALSLLPCGSAGLMAALEWPLPQPAFSADMTFRRGNGRIVVLSGSPARMSQQQLAFAGRLLPASQPIRVDLEQLRHTGDVQGEIDRLGRMLDAWAGDVLLDMTGPGKQDVEAWAGSRQEVLRVSGLLGQVCAGLVQALGRASTLVIVGGDTCYSVLQAAASRGVLLCGEAAPQIPVCRVTGGIWDGLRILCKAGGFGQQDTIAALLARPELRE